MINDQQINSERKRLREDVARELGLGAYLKNCYAKCHPHVVEAENQLKKYE